MTPPAGDGIALPGPDPRRRRHRVQPPAAGPPARGIGHETVEAEDGQQALDRLRDPDAPPIDVILLDIVMPVMDGYETLAALKAATRPSATCRSS